MKIIDNMTEWLYSNLDLVEECKEKKLKPVILIGGASSSGKSYTSKSLQNFLAEHGYKSIIISTDNYNKGLAENIFDIVNKKYYNNAIKNRPQITNEIKKVIINTDFDAKFDNFNLQQIKNTCRDLLHFDINKFVEKLKYEFNHINFDNKNIYDLQEVAQDITALISNKKIIEKKYSRMISERMEQSNIIDGKNYDVIIIEGIYALTDEITKNINEENLIKNFVDCNNKNLFLRRMIRDSAITNCSKSFILKNYLEFVMPEYIKTVLPSKQCADIVLKNNMTFEELREGQVDIQNKYRLTISQLKDLLINSKITKKLTQIDIYFGSKEDDNILRLREEKSGINYLTMKSLVYKGKPKMRKDKSIIRPKFVLADENDLKNVFNSKEDLINQFKKAGITPIKVVEKKRWFLKYKGKEINIDFVNDNIIMELDSKIEKEIDNNLKTKKFEAQNYFEL